MDSFSPVVSGFLKPEATDSPLPFVTLGAVNKSGTFYYEKFFGTDCSTAAGPQDTNAVHWVASCTKLITTIAALQCVDKGLLSLDGDIGDVLPEWKNPKILVGFEDNGEPILKPAQNHITLSGMAYAFLDPLMAKYEKWHGAKPKNNLTVRDSFDEILVFEPGTRWRFSPEAEYVGLLVERVNGGMKLGEYMRLNIFEPLGIKDMTFHLEDREDMRKRLARVWQRTPEGGLQMRDNLFMPDPVIDDFGGTGLYATVPELLKIYSALLRDDGTLLKKETVELMFTPHIPTTVDFEDARKTSGFVRNSVFNSIPDGVSVNAGLGGVLNTTPVPGRRGAPSLTWSGMTNCFWWVDRANGIAGVFVSHFMPGGDNKSIELLSKFEEAVYSATA